MNSKIEFKKQKLIYILGLSHTGSTLLDLILGSHPRLLGLGEIYQVIRPDFNRFENDEFCSCGKNQFQCIFWGPVGEILKKNKNAGIQKRYELVLNSFQDIFGQDRIPVDSSKLPEALKLIKSLQHTDLKVVYLIRDVRAWTISRLNVRNRHPKYFESGMYLKKLARYRFLNTKLFEFILPFLTKRPSYYFILWYVQNRQIKHFLEKYGISHFKLSYEDLGLFPNQTLPKLFNYIDLKESIDTFSSHNSESHVLVGNIKKSDPKRRQGIIYDSQWMFRNEWLLAAAIFRNIMNFNTIEVYKNFYRNSIWK